MVNKQMIDHHIFPEISFNVDGCPTEESLKMLETYDFSYMIDNEEAFHKFMEHLRKYWNWGNTMVKRIGDVWLFSTGGWSGNEAIVDSLLRNFWFKSFFFLAYRRGGQYVFGRDVRKVWFQFKE